MEATTADRPRTSSSTQYDELAASSPASPAAAPSAAPPVLLQFSVACIGLEIAPTSPFHTSTLMSRMKGPTPGKNERRTVRLQCSEEFRPGGRPASLLYDTFFESIVFEDIGTLKSPFVAKMSTSPDMDRKIRVNIYYNSNLSGGKEIIIAATTFGLREMLRSTKQPFCSDLVSEHCVGAKAFLTPVCVPDTIFDTPRFWSLAPTKEKNPLRQEYVFYQETDTSPAVVRDEFAYEPAHVVNTSLAFLTHFRDDLKTSIVAWEDRCKLERIRQGKFVSVSEAARYGWHQLRLTIIASRIRSQLDVLNKTSAALFRDVIDSDDDEEGESTAGGLQGRNSTHASNSNADYTRTCNTFVEAYLEASHDTFLRRIGRTNVEYGTAEPVYGSSISKQSTNAGTKGYEFVAYDNSEIVPQSVWWCSAALGLEGLYSTPAAAPGTNPAAAAGSSSGGSSSNASSSASTASSNSGGKVYHMVTYVPIDAASDTSTQVRLDLFQTEHDNRKSIRMGSCWVPLVRALNKDIWIPVVMVESYAFSEAEIRVQIEICTGSLAPDDTAPESSFCPSMPSCKVPYSDTSFSSTAASSPSSSASPDTKSSNCTTSASPALQAHMAVARDATLQIGSCMDPRDLDTSEVIANCYKWLWDLGYTGQDPLLVPPSLTENTTRDGTSSDKEGVHRRVDWSYSLDWMANYVHSLKKFYATVELLISKYQEFIRDGLTFRKSPLKDELEMQCLPINFHFQFVVSRRQNPSRATSINEVSDFTTCGAMAAHNLGHKGGGLSRSEEALGQEKGVIENLVVEYYKQSLNRKLFHPTAPLYSLFRKIGPRIESFETNLLKIGMRRFFCLTQVISIAVNSFMVKLELVARGFIDPYFAERWLTHAFPLVFESLLSVSGKEKSMLEDAVSVIEVLQKFHFRVLASNPESSSEPISVSGREINIHVPLEVASRLPKSYQDAMGVSGDGSSSRPPGVVIRLFTTIFTLGIDIRQAMATTWESADDKNGNMEVQNAINKRGFQILNDFCYQVMPVQKQTNELHPLMTDLQDAMKTSSKMNVAILYELEKVSVALGGCRVTFCKSGKDRTGMAVTLHQSRELSDIYGFENSTDRIIRDANLMRVYGTRLMVAEKNIGRAVFAINRLQIQFMPLLYRPPLSVLEDVFKGSDIS